jgi:hypothetical protein
MVVAMTLVRSRSRGGRVAIIVAVVMTMTVLGVVASDRGSTSVPALAAGGAPSEQVAANAVGGSTRYVPINPIRVVDTRTDPVHHRLAAGRSMSLAPVTQAVAAATGVAPGAIQAVVLNLTMVDVDGAGYASVWPTGSPMPTVSSANTDVAGQTVANMVTVPVGADGFVSIYSSIGADYIVDVQGVYESATSATAGRFVSLTPRRAIDTRRSSSLSPNSAITVDVAAVGVPADASAAVLNVTATQTRAGGYLTVWPADTAMPVASNLNVPSAGYTVANQVIARVTNGRVSVYSFEGTDVIVDVTGYMTGSTAPAATDGLFVPITPARLLDTRTPGPSSSGQPIASGATLTLPITGRGGVPGSGVQSVALNVTATRTQASGYVTTWPANTPITDTSSLNYVAAGQSVPNHVVAPINGGAVSFYSFGGTDLLVDAMGYWLDATAVAPGTGGAVVTVNTITPPPVTVPAAPATDGAYGFLYQSPPKSISRPYGRWNPCAPIRYMANVDRASQPMVDEMNAAIAQVELATGLDLVYVGPTSGGLDFAPPAGADAVIGFSDQTASPNLAGGVIGIGGGNYNPGTGRVTSGFALADVDGIASPEKLRATFMHEIAHMVGLDHVTDPAQLMYSSVTPNSAYGGGDLRGLWYVGAAQGCVASDQFRASDLVPNSDHPAPNDDTVLVVAVD